MRKTPSRFRRGTTARRWGNGHVAKIFVSYRRNDTAAGYVQRLQDRLARRFGKKSVFLDIRDVVPAENFVEAIRTCLATCQACVVWIGREWLTCQDAQGRRRLDDPDDFVH